MIKYRHSEAECKQTVRIHACRLVKAVIHHVHAAVLHLFTKPGCHMRIPSQNLNPNRDGRFT